MDLNKIIGELLEESGNGSTGSFPPWNNSNLAASLQTVHRWQTAVDASRWTRMLAKKFRNE